MPGEKSREAERMTRIARESIAFGPAFTGLRRLSSLRARISEGPGRMQVVSTDAAPLETGHGNELPQSRLGGPRRAVHDSVAVQGSLRSSEAGSRRAPRRQA
jgi:hypothetical protein